MTKLQGLINHNLSYSNCHAVGICPIFRHIHVKTLWGRAQGCVQVLADWGVPLLKCYLPASHQIWRASLQPGTPFFWQLSTDGTGSIHWNLVSIAPLKSGNASFHRFTRSTSTRPQPEAAAKKCMKWWDVTWPCDASLTGHRTNLFVRPKNTKELQKCQWDQSKSLGLWVNDCCPPTVSRTN